MPLPSQAKVDMIPNTQYPVTVSDDHAQVLLDVIDRMTFIVLRPSFFSSLSSEQQISYLTGLVDQTGGKMVMFAPEKSHSLAFGALQFFSRPTEGWRSLMVASWEPAT